MSEKVKYFISPNSISFYTSDGSAQNIASDHANFKVIASLLLSEEYETEDEIIELVSIPNAIVKSIDNAIAGKYLMPGKVVLNAGVIYYDGVPIHSALTDKMLSVLSASGNIDPWCMLMEKLYQNPTAAARDEMYDWISGCKMPITDQGDLVAYKRVRDDYMDCHSGTILNAIGTTVQLESRSKVDPNRRNLCSVGLHFCSPTYLNSFYNNAGKILILTVNPADVVAIPTDYNFAKGRTWKYTVVSELFQDEAKNIEWPGVVDSNALTNKDKRIKYYKNQLPPPTGRATSAIL